MEKRYQVFVSSTFSDLEGERTSVIQTLMGMDCIPAGMELFPAVDEEQWAFIQKIIDDCDYYILVLGGRYGSVSEDGISYTEREFDYAISRGIKVIALVHGAVDQLPFAKVDASEDAQKKLTEFRDKVCKGRLVKFWTASGELPGLVALSMQKTIKTYPAQGWVRSSEVASSEVIAENNTLRATNFELSTQLLAAEQKIQHLQMDSEPKNIASGSDIFVVRASYSKRLNGRSHEIYHSYSISWDEIFGILGPEVIAVTGITSARIDFSKVLQHRNKLSEPYRISDDDFNTISQQLQALGLIKISALGLVGGGQGVFLHLTESGTAYLKKLRVVAKAN